MPAAATLLRYVQPFNLCCSHTSCFCPCSLSVSLQTNTQGRTTVHTTGQMQAEKHRSFLPNDPPQASGCGSSRRPAERSRIQAAKHRVALRCTLRSTARRCLQNQGQQAPGPRSACPRLTLRSLSSRSNGGGLCRCSSRSSHELAIGSFPRRIYNGSRKSLPPAIDESAPRADLARKQRAMHLRSDFGEVQPEVAAIGCPIRLNLLLLHRIVHDRWCVWRRLSAGSRLSSTARLRQDVRGGHELRLWREQAWVAHATNTAGSKMALRVAL